MIRRFLPARWRRQHGIVASARPTAEQLRQDGDTARDLGRWEEAACAYSAYLELMPDDFDIRVQLGHALKEAGDLDSANATYLEALSLREYDHDLIITLGHLRKMQGDLSGAIMFLARIVTNSPDARVTAELRVLRQRQAGRFPTSEDPTRISDIRQLIASSDLFDPGWYATEYPETSESGLEPIDHYLGFGTFARLSPGPNFDTIWYLERYKDAQDGYSAGHFDPLLHYIEVGKQIGRTASPPVELLSTIISVVDSIRDIDPIIYFELLHNNISQWQIVDHIPRSNAYIIFTKIFKSLSFRPNIVLCIPNVLYLASHLTSMPNIESMGPKLLILICDEPSAGQFSMSHDVFVVRYLTDNEIVLNLHEKLDVVSLLMQALRPSSMLNISSQIGWELYSRRGTSTAAATQTFCYIPGDENFDGQHIIGFGATYFRQAIGDLSGVFVDDPRLTEAFRIQYGVPIGMAEQVLHTVSDLQCVVLRLLRAAERDGC